MHTFTIRQGEPADIMCVCYMIYMFMWTLRVKHKLHLNLYNQARM